MDDVVGNARDPGFGDDIAPPNKATFGKVRSVDMELKIDTAFRCCRATFVWVPGVEHGFGLIRIEVAPDSPVPKLNFGLVAILVERVARSGKEPFEVDWLDMVVCVIATIPPTECPMQWCIEGGGWRRVLAVAIVLVREVAFSFAEVCPIAWIGQNSGIDIFKD